MLSYPSKKTKTNQKTNQNQPNNQTKPPWKMHQESMTRCFAHFQRWFLGDTVNTWESKGSAGMNDCHSITILWGGSTGNFPLLLWEIISVFQIYKVGWFSPFFSFLFYLLLSAVEHLWDATHSIQYSKWSSSWLLEAQECVALLQLSFKQTLGSLVLPSRWSGRHADLVSGRRPALLPGFRMPEPLSAASNVLLKAL